MKKLIVLLMLCLAIPASAGDVLDVPFNVVVSEPVTDVVEVQKIIFQLDDEESKRKVVIDYTVYNPGKTVPLVAYVITLTGAELTTFMQPNLYNNILNRITTTVSADIQSKLPVVPKP